MKGISFRVAGHRDPNQGHIPAARTALEPENGVL